MKRSELVEELKTRMYEPHSEMSMKWTRARNSGGHPALTQAVEWAAETVADFVAQVLVEQSSTAGRKK